MDILVTFQPGKKNIRNYMELAYHLEEPFGRKKGGPAHRSRHQAAYCGGADSMQSDLTNLLHIKKRRRISVRSLEVISKTVKNLAREFTTLHRDISGKLLTGT